MGEPLASFLEIARTKNKERTVRDYTRLLTRHGFDSRIADLENEINDRVYLLFQLNKAEIALIAGALEGQY
jgi:hypothetical protein